MMKTKKGIELNQAFGAILALVLVSVLVIVAILIFANLQTAIPNTGATNVNESFTPTSNATTTFVTNNSGTECDFGGFRIVEIVNTTDSVILPSTFYVADPRGAITPAVPAENNSYFTGATWNVTYDYNYGTQECVASAGLVTQFATYPALVGLVGTIIFLGIVIGVLVASFVFGGKGRV